MPIIRILSWNILQGGGRRLDSIIKAVEKHHPDIFAIQEYRANSEDKANFTDRLHHIGLTSFFAPASSTTAINIPAIASRWPFEIEDIFPGKSSGLKPHCIRARFEKPDAPMNLTVTSLHLPNKAGQPQVFDYLCDQYERICWDPAILIGDFNCGIPFEDSETKSFDHTIKFQHLKRQGWIDAWRERNPDGREFTWISSKKQNGYRYDNALVNEELNGQIKTIAYDHSVREEKFSDHSAMYIDFKLPGEEE